MTIIDAPLVTIGLTTFNAVNSIEVALDSAFSQTWHPIEVVIVDDASSDGTVERLYEFARLQPKIRVFSNSPNSGVAVARNHILSIARGEFVAFFDDDDISLPERITLQYARIIEYERDFASGAPVICHTARRVVYPDGVARNEHTMGEIVGQRAPAGPAVARRILLGEPLEDSYGACPTCSQMARLSTYRLVGGFDPHLRRGEDTDLNIRLAQAGCHFVGIDKPLVTQMMTLTSEKSLAEEYRNMQFLINKHRTFIESSGQYGFCLRWLDLRHSWLSKNPLDFLRDLFFLAHRYPLLTLRRLALALKSVGVNRAFSRFHAYRTR